MTRHSGSLRAAAQATWAAFRSLAGLSASAARHRLHRLFAQALLFATVAWFPVSLLIFGNARFSGTTDYLWQAWLGGTAGLILVSLLSLLWSVTERLIGQLRKSA